MAEEEYCFSIACKKLNPKKVFTETFMDNTHSTYTQHQLINPCDKSIYCFANGCS